MSNIGVYDEQYKNFKWDISQQEIEYGKNNMYNLAYYCVDRICEKGHGEKIALIWEGFKGETRQYTFNELKTYSNIFAQFLWRRYGIICRIVGFSSFIARFMNSIYFLEFGIQ